MKCGDDDRFVELSVLTWGIQGAVVTVEEREG